MTTAGIRLFGLVSVMSLGQLLNAQEAGYVTQGLPDSVKLSTLQFDRTLQTFLWSGVIRYGQTIGPVNIDFRQRLRSRLIQTAEKAVQDEVVTNFSAGAPLDESWRIQGMAFSSILSDNRQLDLNNLSQHQLLIGPQLLLTDGISADIMGGYEFNAQEQQRDRGFSYLTGIRGAGLRLEDFILSFSGRSGQSYLRPRNLRMDSAVVSLSRQFSPQALNVLSVQYANQEREFYTVASTEVQQDFRVTNNIFRRTALEIGVLDTLLYRASEAASVEFEGGILGQTIGRGYRYKSFSNPAATALDERIRETRYFGQIGVRSTLASWLQSSISLNYEEREERHSVLDDPTVSDQLFERQRATASRLANVARRTTLDANVLSALGEKDSLNLSGSASILHYDTPDSLNTDDRDELLIVLGIEAVHRFSSQLSLLLQADATLGHLVYLSRYQSANNNWNRILRFRAEAVWSPSVWLTTANSSEVLANYTVYDFEDQIASVRSFSFRQASWTDSTIVGLGRDVKLLFEGYVRVFERGVLRWKEFKERPENYFVEQSYWPQAVVRVLGNLQMAVGFRYFSQSRYRYEGRSRIFDRRISNDGPTVSARWYGAGGSMVSLDGWREAQHYGEGTTNVFSNVSLTVGMAL